MSDHLPRRVFPLFVGSGRSGTTLVRTIFNTHRELAVAMEANFLVPLLRSAPRLERHDEFDRAGFVDLVVANPSFPKLTMKRTMIEEAVADLPIRTATEAARAVFAEYARMHDKPLYGDKTPGYVKHIDTLAEAFPEARFVHIIRDGRDTAVAYLDRSFGPGSVGEVAAYWHQNIQRGRAAGRALGPQRYTEVRYEDLLVDFESEVKRLTDFLGLDEDPAVYRYWDADDAVLTNQPDAEHHHSARLPPTQGLRDWRRDLSREEIAIFQTIAGDSLTATGYELDRSAVGGRTRLKASWDWLKWQRKRLLARSRRSWEVRHRSSNQRASRRRGS